MLHSTIKQYLLELYNSDFKIQKQIIKFLNQKQHKKQNIDTIVSKIEIEREKLINSMHELMVAFFSEGKSVNFNGEYDQVQLKKGIEVEMEHTNNPLIAEKIAKDHLSEIPNYYDYLETMEEQAKQNNDFREN
jgi:uncharacterized circularly permuted ATP-grasp superfamily protein